MGWTKLLRHFGIVLKDFFWFMDSDERRKKSVQEYLHRNTAKVIKLVNNGDLPFYRYYRKSPDIIVKKIYDWVWKNIQYIPDSINFNKVEMWEDVDVILKNKSADCESMSLLIYCLCKIHLVNPLMIYYVVGKVKEGYGHCWIEYWSDDKRCWYIIDPAYAPRLNLFRKVDTDTRYIERWFKTTVV